MLTIDVRCFFVPGGNTCVPGTNCMNNVCVIDESKRGQIGALCTGGDNGIGGACSGVRLNIRSVVSCGFVLFCFLRSH